MCKEISINYFLVGVTDSEGSGEESEEEIIEEDGVKIRRKKKKGRKGMVKLFSESRHLLGKKMIIFIHVVLSYYF